jgi:phthalate 4,5-dioxygenase oxygenase subunit
MRAQRLELYELPDYIPRKNQSNDYGFDPFEQRTSTYTGMGGDINVHDQWAVESMGAIQDRTREHLGQTDKAIIRYRRMLLKAIDDVGAGNAPLLADQAAAWVAGPGSIDIIGPVEGWDAFWRDQDRRRRAVASWPAVACWPAAG